MALLMLENYVAFYKSLIAHEMCYVACIHLNVMLVESMRLAIVYTDVDPICHPYLEHSFFNANEVLFHQSCQAA